MEFKKNDDGKWRMSLLPNGFCQNISRVFGYGKEKYGENNWRLANNKDGEIRLLDAVYRHLELYREGEEFDLESGEPHLSHAIANLSMLLNFLQSRRINEV